MADEKISKETADAYRALIKFTCKSWLRRDIKEITEWRMLAVAAAIFLLTLGVLAIRYGHVRFPYREDTSEGAPDKAFVRE